MKLGDIIDRVMRIVRLRRKERKTYWVVVVPEHGAYIPKCDQRKLSGTDVFEHHLRRYAEPFTNRMSAEAHASALINGRAFVKKYIVYVLPDEVYANLIFDIRLNAGCDMFKRGSLPVYDVSES